MGTEGLFGWFNLLRIREPKIIGGRPFRPVSGWAAFRKGQKQRQARATAKRRRRAAR